jgi:hypothetical protein
MPMQPGALWITGDLENLQSQTSLLNLCVPDGPGRRKRIRCKEAWRIDQINRIPFRPALGYDSRAAAGRTTDPPPLATTHQCRARHDRINQL